MFADFDKLKYFSLLSQVCSDIETHLGLEDKDLAEFIIHLGRTSISLPQFDSKLKENGAQFPDYLVRTLFTDVHSVLPPLELESGDGIRKFKAEKETGLGGGNVSSVMHKGCFVELDEFGGKEGLLHQSGCLEKMKRGDEVYVKVASDSPGRKGLRLPTDDIAVANDISGEDMEFFKKDRGSNKTIVSGSKTEERNNDTITRMAKRNRMNSPDRYDVNQLISSGVLSVNEYLFVDENDDDGELEEETEIELNDRKPAFLCGKSTVNSDIDMSPVRIVKNPEGSLSRAAALQCALTKERREVREEKMRKMVDCIPKDLNRSWEDPIPEIGARRLALEIRSVDLVVNSMPEWKKGVLHKSIAFGRKVELSIQEQRELLPIYKLKKELVQAVIDNPVLVVIGETGSGKSTQITQYLAEAGYTTRGKIACTQPRRVAAISVAKRVAEEVGCRLGEEVGYAIRFEDCGGPDTVIKYMTEGLLVREILTDNNLSQYSVIMLDEAHERTVYTDVLFGLLKQLVKRRSDLRLIVTSATLDAEKFSGYFFDCNVFTVPGRSFPVQILYSKQPENDYPDAALITVLQIHLTEPEGDILLFLTGQEEIDYACESLDMKMKELGNDVPELIVLPVYGALPGEVQSIIFEPASPGKRKVVVATNIAETSLTIDGIFYVIDPGFAKQNLYNPKIGVDSLLITPISQASAKQRAGRAGRTGPGKCYRLYTESAFRNEMLPATTPEIQRVDLAYPTLTLMAMGIRDLKSFDFMDPPSSQTLMSAMEQLYVLGALDEDGHITNTGRLMAEFPLDPPLSKMLLASINLGCSDEILTVIALVQTGNIFYRPKKNQAHADQKRANFLHSEGDHLMLLSVYEAWKRKGFSRPWCSENFVQYQSLKRAQDVRKQLLTIMDKYKLNVVSSGKNSTKIRKAIAAGFFFHTARKDPQGGYRTLVNDQTVNIHPSSALFQVQPEWVVYHEVVMTRKEYMRQITTIHPTWLAELAPRLFKTADPMKKSKRKCQERIQPLYDRYNEPNSWRLSKRRS